MLSLIWVPCHGRFAELLVDAGGVQMLLQVLRSKHTFAGLSFAFFGLAAIPIAFERVVSALKVHSFLSSLFDSQSAKPLLLNLG